MTAPARTSHFVPSLTPPPQMLGGGASLITAQGHPIPPQEVVQRLKQLSDRLSIEWVDGAWGAAYFGLFQRWGPEDPRWAQVQSGQVPEHQARDLVQMFPRECSAHDMAAYVENRWGDRNRANDPVKAAEYAVEQAQRRLDAAKALLVDKVVNKSVTESLKTDSHDRLVRAGAERAHPMVAGGLEPTDAPKRLLEIVPK